MSIIVVDGIIYERLDTTANWQYVNPVLGNKEKGFEINNSTDKTPVGMKVGDGIRTWDLLPYWFEISAYGVSGKIPSGTPMPFNVPFTHGLYPKVFMMIEGTTSQLVTNGIAQLWKNNYSSSAKTTLVSVDIIGNDNGAGGFNEDTWYSISP